MAIHQSWRKALVVLLMFAVAIPKANANFIARTVVGNMLISGKGASVVLTPTARGSISTAVKAGTTPLENYTGAVASAAGGGAAQVAGKTAVAVADTSVAAQVVGQITKADIAGAVLSCATGGVVGCAIGVGTPLALAYMSLSGARVNPVTGQLETYPPACSGGFCTRYRIDAGVFYTNSPTGTGITAADACQQVVGPVNAAAPTSLQVQWGPGGFTFVGVEPNGRTCRYTAKSGDFLIPASPYSVVDSGTWNPATPEDLRRLLQNNNPAPAIVDELAKYGNIIWTGRNLQLSGPAVVLGPQETTTTQSGNKTTVTTSQKSTPVTYSGSTVTAGNPTTTTTTTTTTKNADGTTTTASETSSTTSTPGTEGETPPEPEPTDTPLPPVPDLYVRKYPNGMEGIYNQYKDQLKNTSFMQLVGLLMPSVGNGGSCPAWPLNLSLASWADYGTHDVAPPCWLWDVAGAILMVGALLLARALIFGG
ncbi:hypothetical protein [Variovorax gossypii]